MRTSILGAPLDRVDGPAKLTGAARYAAEYAPQGRVFGVLAQSTIAKGRIAAIDDAAALAVPGVLAVVTHRNAPPITPEDAALDVLTGERVRYVGEPIAVIVAETSEAAREALQRLHVTYEPEPIATVLEEALAFAQAPPHVNAGYPTDTRRGDLAAAIASADVVVDETYTTPYEHNNPLETHATTALWDDDGITLHDATQGPHTIRGDVATTFGLPQERVRVIAPYVGGGFGSKAFTHPHIICAVQASRVVGRPVTVALTRQQMFGPIGHRTETIQRLRLAAKRDGTLLGLAHNIYTQTSWFEEFAEQCGEVSRHMYAAPSSEVTHRIVRLDLPSPSIMRAPGETPGMFALESAMDELAVACGVDPIDVRVRNEPERDPTDDVPFSTRGYIACFREGARRFGWAERPAQPRTRVIDGAWAGYGVAGATYPARRRPCAATAAIGHDGRYVVAIDASDIGTGAWTMLVQVAAEALDAEPERIELRLGDSALPKAIGAGGSMGAISWGTAVHDACLKLRARLAEIGGTPPPDGIEVSVQTDDPKEAKNISSHAFGAHFCEVRVDCDTGEIRVPRMTSIYGVGRVLNAKTARSQLLGGMVMGIGMALMEDSILDTRDGHWVNHDLEKYHVPTHADIGDLEADWIEEFDDAINPLGAKGLGEIGIVGAAAAVANAVYNATGVRVRALPIRLDDLL